VGHALLAYNIPSDTASGSFTDMTAVADPDFSQRNSHYVFTEQYRMLASMFTSGDTPTRVRFQTPTWNAIGQFEMFNLGTSLEPATNFQVDNWLAYPPPIPMMEEFQIQASNGGAGSLIVNSAIVLGTSDFSMQLPQGRLPILVTATGTTTWTLNKWSGPIALTLSQSLRGGVYAVVGAQMQADDAAWFRIIFPRYKLYNGRKLRPGWACQNALGNVANYNLNNWPFTLGEWGRFHTFELPQVEVLGTAADSTAWVLFLWLVYLGESDSLLQQGLGGGGIGV